MSLTITRIVFAILQAIPFLFGMTLCWKTGKKFLEDRPPTRRLKAETTDIVMDKVPVVLIMSGVSVYIIATAGFSESVTAAGVIAVIVAPIALFTIGFLLMTSVMHFIYPHMTRN